MSSVTANPSEESSGMIIKKHRLCDETNNET
jgi:hypothetical protein